MKRRRKKAEGGEVHSQPLGEVEIYLRFLENLSFVLVIERVG
jgi:hypothetical protein